MRRKVRSALLGAVLAISGVVVVELVAWAGWAVDGEPGRLAALVALGYLSVGLVFVLALRLVVERRAAVASARSRLERQRLLSAARGVASGSVSVGVLDAASEPF